MKKIVKQSSRLIFVFILTMIVAGGILTYLSINSIANLRELTEKKVREEQQYLTEQLSAGFQDLMSDITRQFSSRISLENAQPPGRVLSTMNQAYVEIPFMLDSYGEFLYPRVPGSLMDELTESSPTYRHYMELAQKNEFQHKNYAAAVANYRQSMASASTASDSARSINAMARVYFKMEQLGKSYASYSRIQTNFCQILDENGFPFVYYALLNLIRLAEENPSFELYQQIIHFLEGIENGMIAINSSTSDIIARIEAWILSSNQADSIRIEKLDTHIRKTKQILEFTDTYAKMIRIQFVEWKNGSSQAHLKDYLTINDPSTPSRQIIILEVHKEFFAGFSMNLDSLWSGLTSKGLPERTEFAYTISLQENAGNKQQETNNLVSTTMLSSNFPLHEIHIELQNPDTIDLFIEKRSWTYGIALFLLLGAMLLGIVLIMRDLNRERRLAHLRSDFVSNVSHELKTPLTSIHVFAESVLLDRVKSTSDQKEYLRIILKETERLKRMINNILDFSKREKGKSHYQSRPVDVTALLKTAVEDLSYWLEEMNFRVETDLQEGVLTNGDAEALKQVVLNLLENAIKYSDKVKEINIRLTKQEKLIQIEVADKGIGIAKEQINRIFEKFYRVNNKEVKGIGGTGLGLTVVKEIVDAHEGAISVQSIPGKGSVFTVELNSL